MGMHHKVDVPYVAHTASYNNVDSTALLADVAFRQQFDFCGCRLARQVIESDNS